MLNTGVMLTLVIDVFIFYKGIMTQMCYYFLKAMLISLSILLECLTPLKGRLINVTLLSNIASIK